jgi:hypothetical protein
MVLSKKEFDNNNAYGLQKLLEQMTSIIDNKLSQGKMFVHIKELTDNPVFLVKIIKLYEDAGWKVKRYQGYDQRDGDSWDYLTFS